MQSEQIEFDTLEQQQAVFGAYDENIKIIEKDLVCWSSCVQMRLRMRSKRLRM